MPSNAIACAAATESAPELESTTMGTSDHAWMWNRAFGVYPEEDVQKLWDMSPIKYVANVQAPMLVICQVSPAGS